MPLTMVRVPLLLKTPDSVWHNRVPPTSEKPENGWTLFMMF